MRFERLRVANFRNIEFAELDAAAPRVFLLGANGQGKSNLLEAFGMATAGRSFRTQNMAVLPRRGCDQYVLHYEVTHEHLGATALEIQGGAKGRRVFLDGEKLLRLADFIGRFPVVALSSDDLQLLRGGPAERRRFLDLTLSATDPAYYQALRDFHRGLAERNRLLKQGGGAAELEAFESVMARPMALIAHARAAMTERLAEVLAAHYAALAQADEGPSLDYRPGFEAGDEAACLEALARSRKRDGFLGSTQKGPHRDDLAMGLRVGGARDFASDGQQRALCVALRLAQAQIYRESLGVVPVLLVDDVLGELDPRREAGFWQTCPVDMQIIVSGTERPEAASDWRILGVRSGSLVSAVG